MEKVIVVRLTEIVFSIKLTPEAMSVSKLAPLIGAENCHRTESLNVVLDTQGKRGERGR